MHYKLTVEKIEKNTDFNEQMKQWKEVNRYNGSFQQSPPPQEETIKNVLTVELTEEQFVAIKAEVFKTFK